MDNEVAVNSKVTMYQVDDIVWSKVRGHAWWPAQITKIVMPKTDLSQTQYEVIFLGDYSRASLTPHFLRSFETSFLEMAFTKQTKKML